jgi:hypothetical protein
VGHHCLGAIYEALTSGAAKSGAFSLSDDDRVWLSVDDGKTTRETYRDGRPIETFGALKDCSIRMGADFTHLEVCLRDDDGCEWVVHIVYVGKETKPHIKMVECTKDAFNYIRGVGDIDDWTPGEDDGTDLQRFLYPSM